MQLMLRAPAKKNIFVANLADIADQRQEHFICFSLNSSNQIINKHLVFKGTLTSTIVHPREIFAVAIEDRAARIVIAHNHPSGDVYPSKADIETTQQLIAGGLLLGIPVHDHIIVVGNKHFSFRSEGLIGLDILTAERGAEHERITD